MKEVYKKILDARTKVSVCSDCGKELIDLNEAIRAQKKLLPQIRKEQKVIRLGKSSVVTIPKRLDPFFSAGTRVIVEFDPKSMELRIRKE
ncbi:MAG: hypothetical protein HY517_02480 [Candidatus Aenigmarchaeota archaeon]|nr:hypothetical protein [Candidatus Aenigmarchaeota archaeon]